MAQLDPEKYKKLEQPSEVNVTISSGPTLDPNKYKTLEDPVEDKNPLIQAWEAASTPIVNVPGSTEAMREAHPTVAGIGDFATGVLNSMTSPLNLAMGGLFGGGKAAAAAGYRSSFIHIPPAKSSVHDMPATVVSLKYCEVPFSEAHCMGEATVRDNCIRIPAPRIVE